MNFIKIYNFDKDKINKKCILYKTPGVVFAANIYAHKNCTKKYIKKLSTCRKQVNHKLAEPGIFISIFLVFVMIIFRK